MLGIGSVEGRGRRLRAAADVGRRRHRASCLSWHLPWVRLAAAGVGNNTAAVRVAGRGAAPSTPREGAELDFAHVELSEEDLAFRDELRAFLATVVTDDVIGRDRQ